MVVSMVVVAGYDARRHQWLAAAAGRWMESRSISFLPAKLTSRFLLPISSRQIEETISIADFFPPN
jgi:hypothetical protein